MKWTVIALLAACGGGASIGTGVDPSNRITGSNCQILGTSIMVDVSYDTTLDVGNAWESAIIVGVSETLTSENEFFSCGLWAETGIGSSARGCQRDTTDQPATQNLTHMYSASYTNELFPPINIMVIGNTFDSPGGFGVGDSAFDNFDCF